MPKAMMNSREELQEFLESIIGSKLSKDKNLEAAVLNIWRTDRANLKRYQRLGALATCLDSLKYFEKWVSGMAERAPKLSEEARKLDAEWHKEIEGQMATKA